MNRHPTMRRERRIDTLILIAWTYYNQQTINLLWERVNHQRVAKKIITKQHNNKNNVNVIIHINVIVVIDLIVLLGELLLVYYVTMIVD